MSQRSGQYQYQKVTTTTTTRIRNNPVNVSSSQEVKKGKIDLNMLKNKNVEFYKCNKCGKLKFRLDGKQTTHETGSVSRKTEITEKSRTTRVDKSFEKYAKYNVAAKTKCTVCGNEKMKCTCKKNKRTSVSTTVAKRSSIVGNIDLTPKVKVELNPEKIRKAVEEQRRIAEEEKKEKKKEKKKEQKKVPLDQKRLLELILKKKIIPMIKRKKEKFMKKIFAIVETRIVLTMKK